MTRHHNDGYHSHFHEDGTPKVIGWIVFLLLGLVVLSFALGGKEKEKSPKKEQEEDRTVNTSR
jgi:hypothetical protein